MSKKRNILSEIVKAGSKLAPYAVYFHGSPIRKELNKEVKTILDVGCGQGFICRPITRSKKFFTVGAEVFEADIRVAKGSSAHNDYALCDARYLPFKRKSFDVIICISVLEHVDKEEGLKLLKDMEEVAVKKVILSTPVGFLPTGSQIGSRHLDYHNPHQEHRAGWQADELRALGYKVYHPYFSHKIDHYLTSRHRTWAWMLNIIVLSLLAPLNWISPRFGSSLYCVKHVNPE